MYLSCRECDSVNRIQNHLLLWCRKTRSYPETLGRKKKGEKVKQARRSIEKMWDEKDFFVRYGSRPIHSILVDWKMLSTQTSSLIVFYLETSFTSSLLIFNLFSTKESNFNIQNACASSPYYWLTTSRQAIKRCVPSFPFWKWQKQMPSSAKNVM
jgi:hypothetical protein